MTGSNLNEMSMRPRSWLRSSLVSMSVLVSTASILFALPLGASLDVYDVQTNSDNSPATTRNELMHASEQWHDLAVLSGGVADEDWYRIGQRPYSSYEVAVDAVSGDIPGRPFHIARVAADGTTVLQTASLTGGLTNRSLRFVNATASAITDQYIVVRGAACGVKCGSDDVYRIRASETTASISRFNNSGTQVTVLALQNPADYTITGTVYFWDAAGSLLTTSPMNLASKQLLVLPTQTVIPNVSGHITIAHNGRYGDLSGKGIALEPATGFSFDTALSHRPR
jgi:hypothetical protein